MVPEVLGPHAGVGVPSRPQPGAGLLSALQRPLFVLLQSRHVRLQPRPGDERRPDGCWEAAAAGQQAWDGSEGRPLVVPLRPAVDTQGKAAFSAPAQCTVKAGIPHPPSAQLRVETEQRKEIV